MYQVVNANREFRAYVEELLIRDKRFNGMSKYLFSVSFYFSDNISTACAGEGFVFFNPNFWNKMNHEERLTIVAHELWHIVLDHYNRLLPPKYNQEDANRAMDFVINIGLHDEGFALMKPGYEFGGVAPCLDFAYRSMSTLQVYWKIHKERKKNKEQKSPSQGQGHQVSKSDIGELIKAAAKAEGKRTEDAKDQNQADLDEMFNGLDKANGNTPVILRSNLEPVEVQQVPYKEIFKDLLTDPLSGGKRTFLRPARRQILGMPRLKGKDQKKGRKNRLTNLVYALDISGSITDHQRNEFLTSAAHIKKELNPKYMTILLWDTQIQFEKVFHETEELDNIPSMSGGGTNLTPVFEKCHSIKPETVVIYTDMHVHIPPKPEWDVIWFIPSSIADDNPYLQRCKYGKIYKILKMEKRS